MYDIVKCIECKYWEPFPNQDNILMGKCVHPERQTKEILTRNRFLPISQGNYCPLGERKEIKNNDTTSENT